jgi:hypothetical protein
MALSVMIICADLQIRKPLLREVSFDAWMQSTLHSDPMVAYPALCWPAPLLASLDPAPLITPY